MSLLQNGQDVGIKHFSPFSKWISFLSPFFVSCCTTVTDFVCDWTFVHFRFNSLKSLFFTCKNFCLAKFPKNLNGILHTSSIAPLMTFGAIFVFVDHLRLLLVLSSHLQFCQFSSMFCLLILGLAIQVLSWPNWQCLCQHKQNRICLRNHCVVASLFFFVCILNISVTFEDILT